VNLVTVASASVFVKHDKNKWAQVVYIYHFKILETGTYCSIHVTSVVHIELRRSKTCVAPGLNESGKGVFTGPWGNLLLCLYPAAGCSGGSDECLAQGYFNPLGELRVKDLLIPRRHLYPLSYGLWLIKALTLLKYARSRYCCLSLRGRVVPLMNCVLGWVVEHKWLHFPTIPLRSEWETKQTNKQTNSSSTSFSHYFNCFPNAINCWENPQKAKPDSELGPMFSLLPFTGHTADEAQ